MAAKKTDKRTAPPAPRNTMDVDPSWLEFDPEPPPPPPRVPNIAVEPPPIPGADKAIPPLPAAPAPKRHMTMEVKAEWLEEIERADAAKKEKVRVDMPAIPPATIAKPRGKLPSPIAREEPDSKPPPRPTKAPKRPSRAPKRSR